MTREAKDFWAYREEIAGKVATLRIGEERETAGPDAPARTDERLAQCIWFDSLFVHEGLKTDSGKSLRIVQAGRWNQEEGPDFRGAKLVIDGAAVRGDVEVHLHGDGWRQHRHHLNPEYDSVVLHAYLWRGDKPTHARTSQGTRIENFVMEPVLFPDLETIRQTVRVEDYPYQTPSALGRCQPLMCSLDADYVGGLLDAAGRERLETKTRRYADQAAGQSLDQVLYQAIMTAMGHKANKGLFFLLSKRAPLSEMRDYLRDVLAEKTEGPQGESGREDRRRAETFFQAILLHVARLAPDEGFEPEAEDAEMAAYLGQLRRTWRQFAGYFSDRVIPPTKQWITGARPVNFAHRRVAGVSHLLARWFLDERPEETFARKILTGFDPSQTAAKQQRWIRRELVNTFVVEDPDSFWAWRYNFTSRRAGRPMKLIGENRAASIAFNALLPLLLHRARSSGNKELEERVWQVFSAHPPLESNSMVRHMRTRLFGEDARAKTLLVTEARQQGLFQIFASCCNHNEGGCEDCYYLKIPA